MVVTLKVGGMSCAGCVAAVKRAVDAVAPGGSVAVDLARGEVALATGIDRAAAAAAIRRAGFTVEG